MKSTFFVLVLFSILMVSSVAEAGFDFSGWDALLKTHVKATHAASINYQGFGYDRVRAHPQAFNTLLHKLKIYDPNQLKSKNQRLAFWVNVYNIAAIKLLIENDKTASIRDLDRLSGSVWKTPAIVVRHKSYSLDHIEHKILRPLEDARIHVAIVCASKSCPDLRAEAYTEEGLEGQFKDQLTRFLANPSKGLRHDKKTDKLFISKIFEWFKDDFGSAQELKKLLIAHAPSHLKSLDWSNAKIDYLPYDWTLNQSP